MKFKQLFQKKYLGSWVFFLWLFFCFSPFPVPYLYKLDRILVEEGTFVSSRSYYRFSEYHRYNELYEEFKYYDKNNRLCELNMSATDNSKLFPADFTPGQHIYIYAIGPLKWTAATSVENNLCAIFLIRALIEFCVRGFCFVVFFLLVAVLPRIYFGRAN